MNSRQTKLACTLLSGLICCAFIYPAQADLQPSVIVQSYGKHVGGNIVYTYQVTNLGLEPLFGFNIGCNCQEDPHVADDERPELVFFPLNYDFNTGVPKVSYTAPPGWYGVVEFYEEVSYISIGFEPTSGSGISLLPGYNGTFSITLPRRPPDESFYADRPEGAAYFYDKNRHGYLTGHYSYYEDDATGQSRVVSYPMQLIDLTPPTISVTHSPAILWPPNDKLVPITANITAKDDYDPEPEIKLESITSSETLADGDIKDAQLGTDDRSFSLAAKRAGNNQAGRIYTITYSATDASGNKATSSATVTVPHDQGKNK